MTEEKTKELTNGLRVIRRALLSVSDKTGLVEFARDLHNLGVELISTGGTANALRAAGLPVRDVSDLTGFPEMLDGRVKTLHPLVHGALLAVRDNPDHIAACAAHSIEPIDLAVVNLYPFEATIAREGVTLDEAIEQIDIGGPAMIRSAAKNARDVAVVVSSQDYPVIIEEMRQTNGALTQKTRSRLALRAFERTSRYDETIAAYLATGSDERTSFDSINESEDDADGAKSFASSVNLRLEKLRDLRYGENPHQRAALYRNIETVERGIASAELVSGKEMSFNNYVDADAAWRLVCDFDETAACAIIKHTNPAGVAIGESAEASYARALETDPVSAFGGIVAFNCEVEERAASAVGEIFTEVVVAPAYTRSALEILRAKKNLRILRAQIPQLSSSNLEYRQISGGVLIQTADDHRLKRSELRVVTRRAPSEEELRDMLFAWIVCKHTKSNAIVYAREEQTVGIGAGQMSRVDSVRIGAMRARVPVKNSVLASDAFFPFCDGIDEAARHGITAVIQPGGSVRDAEVIAAADEHNLAMAFTGIRHFKH